MSLRTVASARRSSCIVILALVAATVTACQAEDPPEPVHLVIHMWQNSGQDPLHLAELAEKYEQANDGVTVEVVYDEGQEVHHNAVQERSSADRYGADVVAVELRTLTDTLLVRPEQWVDLGEHLPDIGERYAPSRWTASLDAEGRQLGLPFDLASVAVCYRRDLVAAAGLPVERDALAARWRTWDDFLEVGAEYRQRTGEAFVESARAWFEPVAQSAGAPHFVDQDGTVVAQSSAAIATAWDVSVRMIESGMTANAPPWTSEWTAGMADGRFAAMVCPSWMLGVLPATAAALAGQWDIAALPASVGSYSGGTWLSVPATSEHPAQAAALAAYLTSAESAVLAGEASTGPEANLFPANLEALDSFTMRQDIVSYYHDAPIVEIYSAHARDAGGLSLGPWYVTGREVMGRALGTLEAGQASPARAWRGALDDLAVATGLPLPLPLPPDQGTLPPHVDAFGSDICGPSQRIAGYEGAAPYDGPAPHPITFTLATDGSIIWPNLPAGWETDDPARVQLIGCIIGIDRGERIRTCEYQRSEGSGTFDVGLYHATYTIEVRETATGELVRVVELAGADTSCPFFVQVDSSDPTINAALSTNQLRTAIGDLVT